MNLDELKHLWKSYQEQANQRDGWSKAELSELLKAHAPAAPWYTRSSRVLLNLCMCVVLIGINGC